MPLTVAGCNVESFRLGDQQQPPTDANAYDNTNKDEIPISLVADNTPTTITIAQTIACSSRLQTTTANLNQPPLLNKLPGIRFNASSFQGLIGIHLTEQLHSSFPRMSAWSLKKKQK